MNDAQRLRYTGDQFFLKTRRADGGCLQGSPRRAPQHDARRRALQRHDPEGQNHLPSFGVPEGFTLDGYFEHMAREGFAQRMPRLQQLASAGRLRHTVDEYARRLEYEIEMIKKMGYTGYFLIVWDFIRYARERRHSGRPWPRLGGRLARGLVHAHHRRRSARLRSHLRALPEPRARVAARHRRGLLRAAPRRGDRLRHAEVRPRERRADHHLRDDEGEGRGAGRRARARHAVCRRRPDREADPAGARHDARQGARREPGPQGHGREGPQGQGSHRHRQAPRGHVAPRVGPRRRRGDRARPDHRLRAALQRGARRNHDAVEHEGGRTHRPPEDGLPRAEHADAHPGLPRGDQAHRRHRARHRRHPARRSEDLQGVRRRRGIRNLPVRELRGCGIFSARPSRSASTT